MEKRRKKKGAQQSMDLQKILPVLKTSWSVVSAVGKIALGAIATVLMICVVCAFVFAGILGDYLEDDVMPMASVVLEDYDMDTPSVFYHVNEDGEIEILQKVFAVTSWQEATADEIPEDLYHAAVAIEDKRFYEHQGVDWFTTVKAVANMFFGEQTVGGSSITQQLIKNITGRDSVTVQRKVLEFFDAVYVEKRYEKDVILRAYLNTIYLGQGCNGVKSAAATYFGKELQTLTTAECASLISITNNPSMFDPYNGKEFQYAGEMMNGRQRNRHRQMLVLGEMLSQGWINQEEYDTAVAQELVFKSGIADEDRWVKCPYESCGYENVRSAYVAKGNDYYCPECKKEVTVNKDASQNVYSWFVDAALEDAAKALAERDGVTWNDATSRNYKSMLSRCGYHIFTTLDMEVQNQVDRIYQNLDEIPDTYSAQQAQSGIVIIDNRTGDIVALHGGVGKKVVHDGFSMAVDARRQAGSSIKPISVYAPAFEADKVTPATVIMDMPYSYESDGSPYPKNEDRTYNYKTTVLSGIMNSDNTVAMNTLDSIGVGYGYKYAKEKFGLSTLVDKYEKSDGSYATDNSIGSMSLGAQVFGVTVRDMANAFATFANEGVYREARTFTKIYDSEGNLVLDNKQEATDILGDKAVDYINYCLVSVVEDGTAQYTAQLNNMDVAGKTGTTSGNYDRWFCGSTGYYTAAVWFGFETPEQINLVTNLNPAARLWKKVMQPLHTGKQFVALYDRDAMQSVTICLDSGKLATEACSADIRVGAEDLGSFSRLRTVLVYPEDVPAETCDKHVMVDYCESGNGVANEYCKLHAEHTDSSVVLVQKALVKTTSSEISQMLRVENYGLNQAYLRDDYIYLVNSRGQDDAFKGIRGDINAQVTAPYEVCTVHNQQTWAAFQTTHPVQPEVPDNPNGSATPDTPNISDGGDNADNSGGQKNPAASGTSQQKNDLINKP